VQGLPSFEIIFLENIFEVLAVVPILTKIGSWKLTFQEV
jgi:hypothetical protein